MDERFTYLVEKYLENELSKQERVEYEKYLRDPTCRKYLEDAKKIEKILKDELKNIDWNEMGLGTGLTLQQEAVRKDKKSAIKIITKFGKWIAYLKTNITTRNPKSAIPNPQYEITEDDIPEEIKEDVRRYGSIDDPAARQEVRRMHEQMIRRNRIKRLINYAGAASLIVGLYFLWFDYLVPIPQSVFRAYYKQYEFAEISPATVPDERIRSAMSMYDKADFPGSAGLCRDIIASGTTEGNIHFLYGLNLMAMDSMLRAINEFDAQINSTTLQSTDRQPPVHWYKGLCYLHLNKPVAALWEIGKPYYRKLKKLMRL